jgi:hypothetical protein
VVLFLTFLHSCLFYSVFKKYCGGKHMDKINSNTQSEEIVLDYQWFAGTSTQDNQESTVHTGLSTQELINAATGNDQTQVSTQQTQPGHSAKIDSALVASILNGATDTNNKPQSTAPAQQTEPTQAQSTDTPSQTQNSDGTGSDDSGNWQERYTNLQPFATRKAQEAAEYKTKSEQLATQLEQLQQQLQGIVNPQQAQQQQDIGALDPQSFMDRFMQNPQETLQALIVKNIQPLESKVNPVIEAVNNRNLQDRWDSALSDFGQNNPDMNDYAEHMSQYLNENPWDGAKDPGKLLSNALFYAKGVKYQPPQQVDPKSFLQDQQFVNENILNNPEIVNQILKNTAQNIQTGQPPVSIPSNGGGAQIATPVEKPSTIEQMKQQVRSIFGGNNG